MRAILGIIVGLIAALVTAVAAGVVAAIMTFRVPPGTDPGNAAHVMRALADSPASTQVALGIAWTLAGLAGAWTARRIGQASWAAWLVALLVALYFAMSAWIMPWPIWAKAIWILGPLLGGYVGNRAPKSAPAATTDDPAAEI